MTACHHTNLAGAAFLLACGARADERNKEGMTALDLVNASYEAAIKSPRKYEDQIYQAKIIVELIRYSGRT